MADGVDGRITATPETVTLERTGIFARLRLGPRTELAMRDVSGVHVSDPKWGGFRGYLQLLVGGEQPTTWVGANDHPRTLFFDSAREPQIHAIADFIRDQLSRRAPRAVGDAVLSKIGLDSFGNLVPAAASPDADEQIAARAAPRAAERIILMLTANPRLPRSANAGEEAERLDVDVEERVVREQLRRTQFGRRFKLEPRPAHLVEDLTDDLLETTPTILHFSGHGVVAGIVMEDQARRPVVVNPEALARLLQVSVIAANLRLVVLNACLSATQATMLAAFVDAVIGTTDTIGDQAAIAFARQLYNGLGHGLNVHDAFQTAVAQVEAVSPADAKLLVLVTRVGVAPASIQPLN